MHEIVTDDQGRSHGTDGSMTVTLLNPEGKMFKRRAIKGIMQGTPGDKILPRLNQLAGELLGNLEMDGDTLSLRLHALSEMCKMPKPTEVNVLVTELNGVKVYQCGANVVVTDQDLYP